MRKILFYIVVLVAVAKATAQYPNEDTRGVRSFNRIGMLADKFKPVLNNLRQIISGKLSGHPWSKINLNNLNSCQPCSCGELGSNQKIVNGKEVEYAHKYPWMAAIIREGRFLCGGSLINDKYILTAGHCVNTLQASDYKVRLSVHDRYADTYDEYNARKIIVHKSFIAYGGVIFNDIALIRLDTDGVQINKDVHPVCMPKKGLGYANAIGAAVGWGRTDGIYLDPSSVLREADLYVLSNGECGQYYDNIIAPNMMCAGLRHEGKVPCNNDSGGPLTVANGSVHHLIGITSFGMSGCRSPPAVYTRVTEYLDWIKANTEDACPCHDNDN